MYHAASAWLFSIVTFATTERIDVCDEHRLVCSSKNFFISLETGWLGKFLMNSSGVSSSMSIGSFSRMLNLLRDFRISAVLVVGFSGAVLEPAALVVAFSGNYKNKLFNVLLGHHIISKAQH